jgi:hypothetical protein
MKRWIGKRWLPGLRLILALLSAVGVYFLLSWILENRPTLVLSFPREKSPLEAISWVSQRTCHSGSPVITSPADFDDARFGAASV